MQRGVTAHGLIQRPPSFAGSFGRAKSDMFQYSYSTCMYTWDILGRGSQSQGFGGGESLCSPPLCTLNKSLYYDITCCWCSSIGPLAIVFCFFFLNGFLMLFSPRAKKEKKQAVKISPNISGTKLSITVTHRPKINGCTWTMYKVLRLGSRNKWL